MSEKNTGEPAAVQPQDAKPAEPPKAPATGEVGGPAGPEPTRFGDWEKAGRCSDF